MISLTAKMMNGDLFDFEFNSNRSPDALYKSVWDILPEEVKPKNIWQMMLFRTGEKEEEGWIRPVRVPLREPEKIMSPLENGEVIAVLFESVIYTLRVENNVETAININNTDSHYIEILAHEGSNVQTIYSTVIYTHYDSRSFYFEYQFEEDENGFKLVGEEHDDFMDMLNKIEMSHSSKEVLYNELFDIFRDYLPDDDYLVPDCPIYDLENNDDEYEYEDDEY
jgi:hypothetical protein